MPHKDSEARRAYHRSWRASTRGQSWEKIYRRTSAAKFRSRKSRYDITVDQWVRTHKLQNGCCAICYRDLGGEWSGCVDHNHITGEFRGILCRKCNLALGHFDDNTTSLEQALIYLRRRDIVTP